MSSKPTQEEYSKITFDTGHLVATQDKRFIFFLEYTPEGNNPSWRIRLGYTQEKETDKKLLEKGGLLFEYNKLTYEERSVKGYKTFKSAWKELETILKKNNITFNKRIIRLNTYIIKENPEFQINKLSDIDKIYDKWVIKYKGIKHMELFYNEVDKLIFSTRREALDFLKYWFYTHQIDLEE